LTAIEVAKKNCLVLIAKNLNKGLMPGQVEIGLRILIEEKNIVSIYFPRTKASMHARVTNIEFLNTPIYKKFIKKTHKLQNKYMRFNPHPKSLDGSTLHSDKTLKEL
jgi:hypothetical protein